MVKKAKVSPKSTPMMEKPNIYPEVYPSYASQSFSYKSTRDGVSTNVSSSKLRPGKQQQQ